MTIYSNLPAKKISNRNTARVNQDLSRLIVPSAESLATFGGQRLEILIETVNEGWNSSVPLLGARPQPDYSVGLKLQAFTEDQLTKLSPCIGDITEDVSLFADRQNVHSMTLAVRAVIKLFRAVGRQDEWTPDPSLLHLA